MSCHVMVSYVWMNDDKLPTHRNSPYTPPSIAKVNDENYPLDNALAAVSYTKNPIAEAGILLNNFNPNPL